MNYLKIAIGVLIVLSASRFIPHPPNFTSLLALSFYIPAVFGIKYIPIVVLALLFTDLIIGFHSTMFFTIGSVILIGLISKYFNHSIILRLFGALTGAIMFYLLTNFGVWLIGSHSNSLGLVETYFVALPFFGYSMVSTILYSFIFEIIYKILKTKLIVSN